jgi:hypothetical protein
MVVEELSIAVISRQTAEVVPMAIAQWALCSVHCNQSYELSEVLLK